MSEILAGIDHVIVGVRDLERARMGWTRLGFALSPRGRHLGQETANYCVMFPGDYIELLGPIGADARAEKLKAFLARREGLVGPAFAPAGTPEATREGLAARGLHPSEPRALGRQLELPEGTVVPRFCLIDLPPGETPALDCFICAHLTPGLMRRPEWLDHPNGAVGIGGVDLLAADIERLRPAYEQLLGADQVETDGAVLIVRFGRHRIRFSPGVEDAGTTLNLLTADRESTADYLAQWQIPFDETADGAIAVPPEEANGARLVFAPA